MPTVETVEVRAYRVPTETPEGDGTLRWDATTIVIVEAAAGGHRGLGWTYADAAAGALVEQRLGPAVRDRDALDVPGAWAAMRAALRNDAVHGLAAYAIAAVDVALWDLKAKLLDVPLARLLGRARERVPVYGSGGFTTYSNARLCEQLAGWVAEGIPRVKMKVGADPAADPDRVAAARRAIGPEAELFVDGLRRVRDRVPDGMAVAVAHARPSSAHCAPAIHAHAGAAMHSLIHLEWFHDHVRLERTLFDGTPALKDGCAVPDPDRPGLGVELRRADAERYEV